nr:M23/M56 family metallopeptidase [uncultured Duganella sp.]
MSGVHVWMFKGLLAGVSCVVAGAALWAVMQAALRVWPALASRRWAWLAAQLVVASAALLPFLPHAGRIGLGPTVTLDADKASAMGRLALIDDGAPRVDGKDRDNGGQSGLAAHGGRAGHATFEGGQTGGGAGQARAGGTQHGVDTARLDGARAPRPVAPSTVALALAMLWALLYAAGLARALARLARAHLLWRRLLASARRLSPSELAAHDAFSAGQLREIAQARLAVMETGAAVSPMLVGALRPVLLLPRHLRQFSVEQQQMIVAHELRHWRVRDPFWLGVAAALQTVFWFNPALRWLGAKMTWALELACDQHVLAGRPQSQRKQYAAALLRQWQSQTMQPPGGVAAFGAAGDTMAARILRMRQTSPPQLTRRAACGVALLMAAVLAAGAALQPALAIDATPEVMSTSRSTSATQVAAAATAVAAATPTTPAPESWRYPLDKMRVSGFFGVRRAVSDKPHQGIDLPAARGTPIHAAAAGTVLAAGTLAENNGRYGTSVIIDTGSLQTLYAHMTGVSVKPGDRVAAGQPIGTVGDSGFATGPHLHFEVRRGQQLVDPATLLAGLDAYATKRALAVRHRQQGY